MRFTWDEAKRDANLAKHGLDFRDTEALFEGPTFTYEDERFDYGEDRYVTVGFLSGRTVAIIHTERDDEIRIISMRRATKDEQYRYVTSLGNRLGSRRRDARRRH